MDYGQAQDYIASLARRGWKLGLGRISEFANRAGLHGSLGDGDSPKFIHITGTNGKGSVTAMTQSCLVEQGFRTGAFFSPYVVEPRERVQFGREMISEGDLARLTSQLKLVADTFEDSEHDGVTEFEFKTILGFEYWKQKQCDWVALEVGLGGILDATNIVTPMASAIVSISYDHVSVLGNTLTEIANKKAGVLKPGRPAVLGEMPFEASQEIKRVAAEVGSELWEVGKHVLWEKTQSGVKITTPRSSIEVRPSLFGDIQLHNAAVAYATLELAGAAVDSEAIKRGFELAYVPGRFQRIEYSGKRFICDGAHNADSSQVLAKMLQQAGIKPRICITSMLTGHSPEDFYKPISDLVDTFFVVPIDFERAMEPAKLGAQLQEMGYESEVFDTIEAALNAACQVEDTEDILVCGSFYLVGEVMRRFLLR